jgi:hypothetical protein
LENAVGAFQKSMQLDNKDPMTYLNFVTVLLKSTGNSSSSSRTAQFAKKAPEILAKFDSLWARLDEDSRGSTSEVEEILQLRAALGAVMASIPALVNTPSAPPTKA